MAFWIFVVKDHQVAGKRIPASDVLKNRAENKFWSLNKRAPNVRRLKPGDGIIFYIASKEGRGFAGTAKVASEAHPITVRQQFHVLGRPSDTFDMAIELEDPQIWPRILPVETVASRITLTKETKRLASAFRGSIRSVSEADYESIAKLAVEGA